MASVSNYIKNIQYCDPKLLDDEEFVLEVYKAYYEKKREDNLYTALFFCSDKVKNNYNVCLYAVSVEEKAFRYCSENIKDNEKVALEAVKKYGVNLQYCSERVKNIPEIYETAINKNGMSIIHAPKHISQNRDWCLVAMKNTSFLFRHLEEALRDDDEIAHIAVKQFAGNIEHCSKRLQNDEKLIELTIEGNFFDCCSCEVKNTKKWCIKAIQKNPRNYNACSYDMLRDKDIVLLYLNIICMNVYDSDDDLTQIPPELFDDDDISEAVIKYLSKTGRHEDEDDFSWEPLY